MNHSRLFLVAPAVLLVALFGLSACSFSEQTPTPTPMVIPLPSGVAAVTQESAAQAGATPATRPTVRGATSGTTQAAAEPTPTPTDVLYPPLPAPATPVSGKSATSSATPIAQSGTTQAAGGPTPTPTDVLYAPLPTLPVLATATPTPEASGSAQPSIASPALSGKLVLQTSSGGDIDTVNANGSDLARVAAGLDPVWSPDGKQIAFTSWNEPQGLYVMNADGSNVHMVYHINMAESPTWSPDGSKIAFSWKYKTVRRRGGLAQDYFKISIINLATGEKTDAPLDPDLYAFEPNWGPDGRIVFKGLRGLFVWDQTNPLVQITDEPLAESPVWSPDAKHIIFAVRLQDRREIAMVNSDGSGLTYLTNFSTAPSPIQNVAPTWSPDGKSIAFLTNRDGDWRIYVMNADGSDQHQMMEGPKIVYQFADERVMDWTN
jgi:TolB protein